MEKDDINKYLPKQKHFSDRKKKREKNKEKELGFYFINVNGKSKAGQW